MTSKNVSKDFLSSFFDQDDLKNIEKAYGARHMNKGNAPKRCHSNLKKFNVLNNVPLKRRQVPDVPETHKDDRVLKNIQNESTPKPKRSKYESSRNLEVESFSHVSPEVVSRPSDFVDDTEVRRNAEIAKHQDFVVPGSPAVRALEKTQLSSKDQLLATVREMKECGLFNEEEISFHIGCICYKLLKIIKKLHDKNPRGHAPIQLFINDLYDRNILDRNKFYLSYDNKYYSSYDRDNDVHSMVSGSTMPQFQPFFNFPSRPFMYDFPRYNSFMAPSEIGFPMFSRPYPPSEFGESSVYRPFGRPSSVYNQERMDYMFQRPVEMSRSEAFYRQTAANSQINEESSLYPPPFRRPPSNFNEDNRRSMSQNPARVPFSEASFRQNVAKSQTETCRSKLMATLDGPSRRLDFSKAGTSNDITQRKFSSVKENILRETSHFSNQDSVFAKPSSTFLCNKRPTVSLAKNPLLKNTTNRDSEISKFQSTNSEATIKFCVRGTKRKRESSEIKRLDVPKSKAVSSQSSVFRKTNSQFVLNDSNSILNVSVTRSGRVSKPPANYWSNR